MNFGGNTIHYVTPHFHFCLLLNKKQSKGFGDQGFSTFQPEAHSGYGDKAGPGCLALWSELHLTHLLPWGSLALVQLCWDIKQCNFVCLINSHRCSVSWMCFLLFLRNSCPLQKLSPRFLCLKTHLLRRKQKWCFNDHGKWNRNLDLIISLFF